MNLNRKFIALPFAVIASISLTACGSNDNSLDHNRNSNNLSPVGYYSNENHDPHNTNIRIMNDDDGPVTELMDHSLGEEQSYRDGRFSRTDENYHGHISYVNPTRSSYYEAYDGNQMEQIINAAEQVESVDQATAATYDHKIIIGVLPAKDSDKEAVKQNVYKAVKPYTENKQVKIITNQSEFYRISVIDNNLRAGLPREEINENIEEIFNTID